MYSCFTTGKSVYADLLHISALCFMCGPAAWISDERYVKIK